MCGLSVFAQLEDRPIVELIDLPAFGRPTHLVRDKHRWHGAPAVAIAGECENDTKINIHLWSETVGDRNEPMK
jgi:hypothetical protein